jgi:hypothetical protein
VIFEGKRIFYVFMTKTIWKKITVPRNATCKWGSEQGFTDYIKLLKNSIFPAIDELISEKLIDNYHFMNHANFDLCISIFEEKYSKQVEKILAKYNLPQKLDARDEENKEIYDILNLNTQITRKVIEQKIKGIKELHQDVIHYQNNQIGMTTPDEINFLISEALKWQFDLGYRVGLKDSEKKENK